MKIHYAGIIKNDFVDGSRGICVSYWTQGCPFHCLGCHNPETWNFDGGKVKEYSELENEIITAISANGVQRNFSVLGGEPFCDQNINSVVMLICKVRKTYPSIKIFVWTGNTYENLLHNPLFTLIQSDIDYLIDGPFEIDKRDVRLLLRGSTNQRVIDIQRTLQEQRLIVITDTDL